ncbi:MAG: exo-alpha-sialidase [Chloroflexi bacterium]|nr:exo-alpha-sialidase [Chloroflexota bacterium]
MQLHFRALRQTRRAAIVALSLVLVLALPLLVFANVPVTQISFDTYTNTTSQHKTQVEPDTFSFGNTIVMATQTGRFFDGGSSNIAWATSTNGGATWTGGNLPGLTKHDNPANPWDRATDPAVAYDAQDNVWMISSLVLLEAGGVSGVGVVTSRSTDGGLTWGNPILIPDSSIGDVDKNWIACDNTATSLFYGNCYTEWDEFSDGDRIYMSTSTDGGLNWGPRLKPANNATGLGGQPVVQPNGTVIVPAANANETQIIAFRSTNGGTSWSSTVTVASAIDHTVAGGLRTGPLPSAEIDSAGKVYVAWQDCRFRAGCARNDIVMSTSNDGVTWSAVTRIPIDATSSKVDHFIPGLAVDKATSGASAHLGLTYYYYPKSSCSASTCQLNVGFIESANGSSSWSAPTAIAGPMSLSWLPNTSQGRMVGDYISTSFNASGQAFGAFAVAFTPTAGGTDCATATPNCNQATYTVSGGLRGAAGSFVVNAGGEHAIPSAASDHASANAPIITR